LPTSVTSGPSSIGSSASAALQSCLENRLRARTASLGSTLYSLTWKHRATPSGRLICALRASAPRISGKDCGLLESGWATPTVHDTKGTDYNRYTAAGKGEGRSGALQDQAQLSGWPTPRSTDGGKGSRTAEGCKAEIARKGRLDDLPSTAVYLAGWVTTTTRDWKDSGADIRPREDGSERFDQLPRQANLAGWGTPTAQAARHGSVSPAEEMRDPNNLWIQAHAAGWNTPAASDGNGGKRPHPDTTMTGQHPEGRKVNMGLASQVHIGFIKTEPARLTAAGELLTGSSAGMESGGQLNPAHSRWLMGLPPEWDACAPMATRLSRKSRQK